LTWTIAQFYAIATEQQSFSAALPDWKQIERFVEAAEGESWI